jgi:integrase
MASIQKRKDVWQVRVRVTGLPTLVRSFDSRKSAQVWANEKDNEQLRGVYRDESDVHKTTLSQLIDRYLVDVTPLMKSAAVDAYKLRALQQRTLSHLPLSKLTPSVLAQHRDLRLRAVTNGTVIRELAYISSVINHARREWGVNIPNPVALVKKPVSPQGRDRILEPQEISALLAELTPLGRRSPWMLPIVQMALETAMRRGELLALQWKHINLREQVAVLQTTKNGERRIVPLSMRAVATLEGLPRNCGDRVFPMSACAVSAAFERAAERACLVDLHFHDLRHTAITLMADKLPNVIELAAVSGHKSLKMLQRYYHPSPQALALKLG